MNNVPFTEKRSGETTRRILTTLVAIELIVLYIPIVIPLVKQWMADPNYRHGILIPIISAYLVYSKRGAIASAKWKDAKLSGIAMLTIASVLLIGGTAASELFTSRLSIPFMLLGLSLLLKGKEFTRLLLFPLVFLFFMIPLPYIIYYKLTFPLQLMSAKLSAGLLHTINVSVIRKGNVLILPNYTLEVVAACSGLRSLMTMITLALIMAAFMEISLTGKAILVAMAVPSAVFANVIRLVVTALGAVFVGPEFAEGTMHEISGLIVFSFGLLFLIVTALIVRWIERNKKGAPGKRGKGIR